MGQLAQPAWLLDFPEAQNRNESSQGANPNVHNLVAREILN